MTELERRLDLFGTEVRILIGAPAPGQAPGARLAAELVA